MRTRPFALALAAGFALFASLPARGFALSADLSITKTRTTPSPANPGDVIGYDITVTNNGPDTASNVVVSDVVPPGTTFDEGGVLSAGWNCTLPPAGGTGTMTCTVPSLGVGIADFYIEVDVDPGSHAGEVDNTATVSSDTPDPDTSNNASTVATPVNGAPTVPTLSGAALAALAAAVSLAAVLLLRR